MKKRFILLFIAFCLMIAGINVLIYEAMQIKIIDNFDKDSFDEKTLTYDLKMTKNDVEIVVQNEDKVNITYDNTIEKDSYKIVINYYSEIIEIDKMSATSNDKEIVYILVDGKLSLHNFKELISITIDGLKDKNI